MTDDQRAAGTDGVPVSREHARSERRSTGRRRLHPEPRHGRIVLALRGVDVHRVPRRRWDQADEEDGVP